MPAEVDGDVYAVLLYGDEEPWLRATPAERDEMYAMHGNFVAGVFERDGGDGRRGAVALVQCDDDPSHRGA